jgi:hypothetical protein
MNHTREEVMAAAQSAFSGKPVANIMEILDLYGVEPHEGERARVQLAILKLSEGNDDKLLHFVEAAKQDYRDVLLWAETPDSGSSSADSSHVYDKAKYHVESIEELGLPDEHAENHTVFFLRWLMENDLMSDEFMAESTDVLTRYQEGRASIHDIYRSWDTCLIDDMLSERGNAFARHYFDFAQGSYLTDYAQVLQKSLPSEFHVAYSEENYHVLRERIDERYRSWRATHP